MKYKAYANRKEITNFPVNGSNTKEIWGGNTLLWKKESGILEEELFRIYTRFTGYDEKNNPYVCEYSLTLMNQSEDGKCIITNLIKAGTCAKNESGTAPIGTSYYARAYLLFKAQFNSQINLESAKFFKVDLKQWDENGNLTYENTEYKKIAIGSGQYEGYYSYNYGFSSGSGDYEGLNKFLIESNFPNISGSSQNYSKSVYTDGIQNFDTPKKMKEYVVS